MKTYSSDDINRDRLTHLIAEDLYKKGDKIVFDAKSGRMLGTLGYDLFNPAPDEEEPPQPEDPNQLKLF